MKLAPLGIFAALSVSVATLACGNEPTGFGADYGVYGSGNKQPSASQFSTGPDGGTTTTSTSPGAACRTGTSQAKQIPLHLVLLLDRSGSMCEYVAGQSQPRDCTNASSKWQQVRAALGGFFTSPKSQGMNVSLIAFPNVDTGDYCNTAHYVTPSASGIPLPDLQNTLLAAVDSNPSTGGGPTPTLSGLTGAVQVAQSVLQFSNGGSKVAILVATDGVPAGQCSDANDIGPSTNLASSVAASIPTYVLGVGDQLGALNALAMGGGTQQAFMASTGNPSLVGQQVTDALNKIRVAALGCEYQVPAAPPGQTLDPAAVNVEFTNSVGHSTVPYSKDCATGTGWQYDNPAAPKTIRFCKSTCDQLSADATGKVDIVFGCATVGDKVR